MTCSKLRILGMAACLTAFAGCDDDDVIITPDAAVDGGLDAPVIKDGPTAETGGDTGGDAPKVASALYMRLKGAAGINAINTDFATRVSADPRINGYFLNSTVDSAKLIKCLNLQVGAATGGLEVYPSDGCRNMADSHKGMGVSQQDFDNLVEHFAAALTAANVAGPDITAIAGVLVPMKAEIVEDPMNNKTVYQRVGRKPAINTVVDKLIANIKASTTLSGFFNPARLPRFKTCLVRQVCDIDGPCLYGKEVNSATETGVSPTELCRDMLTAHAALTNPHGGGAAAKGIVKGDFDAFIMELKSAMDMSGVSPPDRDAILGVLNPMCSDIATGPGCGALAYGVTADSKLVKFDVAKPAEATAPLAFSGMQAGEKMVGITVRPKNGKVYVLGDSSRIYEVNTANAALTAVGTAQLTPLLSGSSFGFDFNPTADKIRVTSNLDQSLRLDPDTGLVAVTDVSLKPFDAALGGVNVVSVAYTNSRLNAMKTTLFGIDSDRDKLIRIGGPDSMPTPNDGVVTEIGDLGVLTTANAAIDIKAPMNVAYGALEVTAGKSTLYTINLSNGAATLVGDIGTAAVPVLVRAIAIAP